MKKSRLFLVLLIIVGIVYFGCSYFKGAPSVPQIGAMPVDVMMVKESDFYPSLSFVAKIEAKDKVAIRARVTGFLTKRLFKEGDFVEKGQLLFEIEKNQFQANVRKGEANLSKARANEANAKAQYNRAKDLIKTKDVSLALLDQREAEFNSSEALVKQAQSDLDLVKLDLEYTDIRAPIFGRIGVSFYSEGSLIGPDSGELASIVTTTPMYAVFSVSENQLFQITDFLKSAKKDYAGEGADISFQYSNGVNYPLPGTLNFVDTELDPQMNTLKIRASFPNPDNTLIAGQYGRINIQIQKPQHAILIPQVLVQQDLMGSFVYVVGKDNILQERRIDTGLELTTGEVVVMKGLIVGDKLLMNNFQKAPRLKGFPVQPVIMKLPAIQAPLPNEGAEK